MSWTTQIFVFGFIALGLFFFSQIFIWEKKWGIGLLFAGLELISATAASLPWMHALRISGKVDWLLFGVLNYPPIGAIFIAMFVVGIRCAVVNILGMREQKKSATAAQA